MAQRRGRTRIFTWVKPWHRRAWGGGDPPAPPAGPFALLSANVKATSSVYYAHPDYCFTDTVDGTKAADGQAVAAWKDAYGGRSLTVAGATLVALPGGRWAVDFNGTTGTAVGTAPGGSPSGLLVGWAGKLRSTANGFPMLVVLNSGGNIELRGSAGAGDKLQWLAGGGAAQTAGSVVGVETRVVCQADGSAISLQQDGGAAAATTSSGSYSPNALTVSSRPSAVFPADAYVFGVVVQPALPAVGDAASVDAWLASL